MFETLRQSLKIGVVTTSYPQTPPEVSSRARGKPEIDWANWKDARPAATICPTAAIEFLDRDAKRTAALDLGKCIFLRPVRRSGHNHSHDESVRTCRPPARRPQVEREISPEPG